MIDLTYTDAGNVEQGIVKAYQLDLAYGSDENDFELTLPIEQRIEERSFVYIDGTEWGGIVRGGRESTMEDAPVYVARGETWHGILAQTFICPTGAYLSVSGEANDAIAQVLGYVGLQDVFDASAKPSGITVSHRFERFTDCYGGFRKMLAESGAKLRIDKQPGGKPTLCAVPIGDYVERDEANRYGYSIEWYTPVNHLICIGMGELEERTVLHLYADSDGNVSQTQTLFGLDEIQDIYEYNNIDEEQLLEEGTKRLKELQSTSGCELLLPEGAAYDVGDMVGIASEKTGRSVIAAVSKVIVKVGGGGLAEITNEVGEVSVGRRSASGSSSATGGIVYKAGDGIEIAGATIAAKVTQKDLEGKADKSHSHSWESVTGKPAAFPPSPHSHSWESVTGKPSSFTPSEHDHDGRYYTEAETDAKLAGKSDTTHAHKWGEIEERPAEFPPAAHSHAWGGIEGKPDAFPPSDHEHPLATKDSSGFMSAADKARIEALSGGSVTGVKGSAESAYRTGNVDLTAANIGAASSSTNGYIGKNGYQLNLGGDVDGDNLTLTCGGTVFGLWSGSNSAYLWTVPITAKSRALEAYPVGSVYMSWNATSPASLFGGTWTAITGRFPYFNNGTATGGSNTHTLSVNEMPSHTHNYTDYHNVVAQYNGLASKSCVSWTGVNYGTGVYPRNTGGSAAHNNMPAYQTLYAWRRTA